MSRNPVAAVGELLPTITDRELVDIRDFFLRASGIKLSGNKASLVSGRLGQRLRARRVKTFGDYLNLIMRPGEEAERQLAIDLLTTNETYFFREPRHFKILRELLENPPTPLKGTLRLWSAACSTGEEPYTLAMVVHDILGDRPWSVLGTDLSHRVLETARRGLYPLERTRGIPQEFLRRYCLNGQGPYAGQFLICRELRQRVTFETANLTQRSSAGAPFDVIFLRNVLIYFDLATKRQVIENVVRRLKPGGHLVVGMAEALSGVTDIVQPIGSTVYRKSAD